MTYFALFTLIINSIGFLFFKWWFYIFYLGSIIIFFHYLKPIKYKTSLDLLATVFTFLITLILLLYGFIWINFKPAIWFLTLGLGLILYFENAPKEYIHTKPSIPEKFKQHVPTSNECVRNKVQLINPITRFRITYQLPRVPHYFEMVKEYHSAYDQGIIDFTRQDYIDNDGDLYPLYDYFDLPCRLDQDEYKYKVSVAIPDTNDFFYIGTLEKSVELDKAIDNMARWYVRPSGGSSYYIHDGKYEKIWDKMNFDLIIEMKV